MTKNIIKKRNTELLAKSEFDLMNCIVNGDMADTKYKNAIVTILKENYNIVDARQVEQLYQMRVLADTATYVDTLLSKYEEPQHLPVLKMLAKEAYNKYHGLLEDFTIIPDKEELNKYINKIEASYINKINISEQINQLFLILESIKNIDKKATNMLLAEKHQGLEFLAQNNIN